MGRAQDQGAERPVGISIHPSRVGWDFVDSTKLDNGYNFNPPIPCGMGLPPQGQKQTAAGFQSTHPVWDGTT